MTAQDIRWIQRFHHFIKAFSQLNEAVQLTQQRPLSKLEAQGLMHIFEYTHELAWNTLKDFLESRGVRNLTSHPYYESTTSHIVSAILNTYFAEFEEFQIKMDKIKPRCHGKYPASGSYVL